jgi:mRNA-degrading endonuclease RelE of RelBE toxin-antitoxin system
MRVIYSERFRRSYKDAPSHIQGAFERRLTLLLQNLRHPSLRAKKYDETRGIWQARVDGGWRFYFTIEGDAYHLHDIIPHPK